MGEMLSINHLSYSYHNLSQETLTLSVISFDVHEGEFLAVVGPSGCGKSTLLPLIAGLLIPSQGTVLINGKEAREAGKNIGYMLQKDHLLDWRTTLQNVTLGLEIQNKLTDSSYILINQMLETYGLIAFQDAKPSELSGGMRQRAALIRTLLLEPDILLLDEPFSALDYQTRLEVSDDIYAILKREQKTAILITHDIAEAISMADRIVVLSGRPAKVKTEVDIHLTLDGVKTPFRSRSAPEFQEYFNVIWKELNQNASFV